MPNPPTYPGVYVEETRPGPRQITGVNTNTAVFIGPTQKGPHNVPINLKGFADFERDFGGLAAAMETGYAVKQFFVNGGTDAWVLRVPVTTEAGYHEAIRALDVVDSFNLLALPGVASLPVLQAAAENCQKRRAFLIVDAPPECRTPEQMRQTMESGSLPRTSFAAIYYPWVRIDDPLRPGQTRVAAPSGTIAGVIARTDIAHGVWKAPAGREAVMQGVHGLEYPLSDAENGSLNPLAVNCLRTFPTYGTLAWGARTLMGADRDASEWKYIPVRRLALFIEESISRGMQWAVFEPNAEPLWAQFRISTGVFMQSLFSQGAFQGHSPREAYFVKCDAETTTRNDIDNGLVNIEVGFAPLKPAEFVVIRISVNAAPLRR